MKYNNYLTEFYGKTHNNKTLNQIHKYIMEERRKSLGYNYNHAPIVEIIARKSNALDVIRSVGASVPHDLINDNFGQLLASFFSNSQSVTVKDTSNTSRTMAISYNLTSFWGFPAGFISSGTQIKLGSGVSAVARNDYKIETDLLTSPESGYVSTGNGTYSPTNRTVKAIASFNAGATETIKESGLFLIGGDTAPTSRTIMLTHENVSPAVSFVLGDPVSVKYTWGLS